MFRSRFVLRLLFVLFFLQGLNTYGQLSIAKNSATCLYGLKDAQGEWAVEAIYTAIQPFEKQYFIVSDLRRHGIIDKTGKLVVPALYDKEISLIKKGFIVGRNGMKTVITFEGKALFPEKYSTIFAESFVVQQTEIEYYYLYDRVNDSSRTTVVDETGKVLLATIGHLSPFRGKSITSATIYTFKGSRTEVGPSWLVNRDGTKARPEMYSSVSNDGSMFVVKKDWQVGVISNDNVELFPLKYNIRYINESDNVEWKRLEIKAGGVYMLTDSLGNKGLMTGLFEVMVSPVFQEIKPFTGVESAEYMVRLNGRYGLMSYTGKYVMPPVYDTIDVKSVEIFANNLGHIRRSLVFCKKNGKYTVLDRNQKTVVPGEFVDHSRIGYKQAAFVLTTTDEVFFLKVLPDYFESQRSSPFIQLDSMAIYKWENNLIVVRPVPDRGLVFDYKNSVRREGKYFLIEGRGNSCLIDSSSYTLVRATSMGRDHLANNYLQVSHKNRGKTLFDLREGRIVFDTLYEEIDMHFVEQGVIWVKNHGQRSWLPFDVKGKALTDTKFDWIMKPGDEVVARKDGFFGLVNGKFQWVIQPMYLAMKPINSTLVAIFTKGKKFGVIDKSGKLIVDTVYTDLVEVYRSRTDYQDHDTPYDERFVWLFRNGGKQLLFDGTKASIYSAAKGDAGYIAIQRRVMAEAFYAGNFCANHRIRVEQVHFEQHVLAKAAYKWFYPNGLSSRYGCNFAGRSVVDPETGRSCGDNFYEEVNYIAEIGAKYCVLKRVEDQSYYSMEMPVPKSVDFYASLIWVNGQAKLLSLDDIFGTKGLLDRLLLAEFRRIAPDECSNPGFQVERFRISKDGVHVETKNGYDHLITITELAKHPESKWLCAYLK